MLKHTQTIRRIVWVCLSILWNSGLKDYSRLALKGNMHYIKYARIRVFIDPHSLV